MRALSALVLALALSMQPHAFAQATDESAAALYVSCSLLVRNANRIDGPEQELRAVQPALCRELARAAPSNWGVPRPGRYQTFCPPASGAFGRDPVRAMANAYVEHYDRSPFPLAAWDAIQVFQAALASTWPCSH